MKHGNEDTKFKDKKETIIVKALAENRTNWVQDYCGHLYMQG